MHSNWPLIKKKRVYNTCNKIVVKMEQHCNIKSFHFMYICRHVFLLLQCHFVIYGGGTAEEKKVRALPCGASKNFSSNFRLNFQSTAQNKFTTTTQCIMNHNLVHCVEKIAAFVKYLHCNVYFHGVLTSSRVLNMKPAVKDISH